MQLGMIGLGRMGANLVRRLVKNGHECVVYDVNAASVKALTGSGITGASSLQDFVAKLKTPAPLGPQWRYPFSAVLGAPVFPGVRGADSTPGAMVLKIGSSL